MKNIIDHFVTQHPNYTNVVNGTLNMNEIIAEANGDARKALNLIYKKKLEEIPLERD